MNEPPKRKRRWFQFSLRSLMIVVTLLAIPCAWLGRKIEQKRKEREAVEAIIKLGGRVAYDYELAGERPAGLDWLRKLVGENYFNEVEYVDLHGKAVTDAGLETLKGLTQLHVLWLGETQVSDAGLANLNGLTQLRELDLTRTNGSDAGLEKLKGLTQLQNLWLTGTIVDDAGLKNLKSLTKLQVVDLTRTKVTDAGVNELQKSLPDCKIKR